MAAVVGVRGTRMRQGAVPEPGRGAGLGERAADELGHSAAREMGRGAGLWQRAADEPGRGTRAVPVALAALTRWSGAIWRYLREVSGDDAYERYLAHHAAQHAGEAPLSPKEYFAQRQRQKWSGVTRCC